MRDYVILTDSGCDIAYDLLDGWNVQCIDLIVTDDEGEHTNREIVFKDFYDGMRAGKISKTSAAGPEAFFEAFTPLLEDGKDILYICFSSGLSSTYGSAKLAADELMEKYEGSSVKVIDSLCASSGHGLLVYFAVKKKNEGASLEENFKYTSDLVPHICHWFTVDDLVYLKRGGRVSPTVALAGAALGIKPILHVDDEGHLINVSKTRGRKASIKEIFNRYAATAVDPEHGEYIVSGADCREDVEALEKLIIDAYGNKAIYLQDIGPVIGSHSGPGTLALFFVGTNR